jgi:hypothetical protein
MSISEYVRLVLAETGDSEVEFDIGVSHWNDARKVVVSPDSNNRIRFTIAPTNSDKDE